MCCGKGLGCCFTEATASVLVNLQQLLLVSIWFGLGNDMVMSEHLKSLPIVQMWLESEKHISV